MHPTPLTPRKCQTNPTELLRSAPAGNRPNEPEAPRRPRSANNLQTNPTALPWLGGSVKNTKRTQRPGAWSLESGAWSLPKNIKRTQEIALFQCVVDLFGVRQRAMLAHRPSVGARSARRAKARVSAGSMRCSRFPARCSAGPGARIHGGGAWAGGRSRQFQAHGTKRTQDIGLNQRVRDLGRRTDGHDPALPPERRAGPRGGWGRPRHRQRRRARA
jgi:hypothetical protein